MMRDATTEERSGIWLHQSWKKRTDGRTDGAVIILLVPFSGYEIRQRFAFRYECWMFIQVALVNPQSRCPRDRDDVWEHPRSGGYVHLLSLSL